MLKLSYILMYRKLFLSQPHQLYFLWSLLNQVPIFWFASPDVYPSINTQPYHKEDTQEKITSSHPGKL